VFRKDLDLLRVDPDRVREPNVRADPTDFLHIPNGTVTEALQAELFLIFGLCQVSM
jgi:hypothetical protein